MMSISYIQEKMSPFFALVENVACAGCVISTLAAAILGAAGTTLLATAGLSYLAGRTLTTIVIHVLFRGRLDIGHYEPVFLVQASIPLFKFAGIAAVISASCFLLMKCAEFAKGSQDIDDDDEPRCD